jgi:hypothetical protein
LLWWEGCPSWERALDQLRAAMSECGLDPEAVEVKEIATEGDAEAESFPGSPTIRIDGEDVQPPGDNPVGLSCRVYRRRDGSTSPLPDPEELRESLRAAAA